MKQSGELPGTAGLPRLAGEEGARLDGGGPGPGRAGQSEAGPGRAGHNRASRPGAARPGAAPVPPCTSFPVRPSAAAARGRPTEPSVPGCGTAPPPAGSPPPSAVFAAPFLRPQPWDAPRGRFRGETRPTPHGKSKAPARRLREGGVGFGAAQLAPPRSPDAEPVHPTGKRSPRGAISFAGGGERGGAPRTGPPPHRTVPGPRGRLPAATPLRSPQPLGGRGRRPPATVALAK